MRTSTTWLACALLGLFGLSCSQTLFEPDEDEYDGIPIVGNATNAFSFVLAGGGDTLEAEYELSFNGDDLNVGVTVAGYRRGTGRFELVGEDGEVFFSRDLGSNLVEGNTTVGGHRPVKAVVRVSGFTGVVTIGVAVQH